MLVSISQENPAFSKIALSIDASALCPAEVIRAGVSAIGSVSPVTSVTWVELPAEPGA